MNLKNQRKNQNNNLNLNLLAQHKGSMSSNRHSIENNNNRILILNEECKDNDILFNTFSSKIKIEEKKSQKGQNSHIKRKENKKINKIRKAQSANFNKIKYYDDEEDRKRDSYLYLEKLKKYYSLHNNIYNNNKSKYSSKSQSSKTNKIRITTKTNEIKNTNDNYTNSKLSMTIDSNNKRSNIYYNIIQKNTTYSHFNKNNKINNNISEIINTRKKFNETYNHFYYIEHNNSNKKAISKKNNNTSDYSSLNDYWKKRNKDNSIKIVKIRKELLKKGQEDINSVPKINNKSKELVNNSIKKENDNFKYNKIFDKLFHKKNMSNSNIARKKRYNTKPKINQKSKNMTRTIDDLFLWNTKRKNKIKENETTIYKKQIFHKKNINLTSETILKERRPFYLNKKVEDRLLEQGKYIKLKNNKIKNKFINEITEQKKYSNINFNNSKSIKSKYMPKEESKNNENNSKINKSNNIFNFNYDYNINRFNKRNSLFDKNQSNILKELNDKTPIEQKLLKKNMMTLPLQNYMKSRVNHQRNNIQIKYNNTDLFNINYKHNTNNKEEIKLNSINNNEKNNLNEKNSIASNSKDKRLEDLRKIMDFSEKLYKNQNKIIS